MSIYVSGNDHNWSFAPWNEVETDCDSCNGEGYWYEANDGSKITKAEYEKLSIEEKDDLTLIRCEKCDGEGYIITY